MSRSVAVFVAACAVASPVVFPHDVITTKITFSKEIVRLLNKRCVTCHRDGGTSFSLATYEAARPWAKAIKEEVDARRMPPWQAIKGFSEFKDDRGLTQEEIELIDDWVEGGAPEGNPKFVPKDVKIEGWKDPDMPKGASAVVAGNGTKIAATERVVGIRPKDVKKGATVQIIAARPDGTIEPLLWIYQFNPDYVRTYYYANPVSLPAGTEIQMSPPDSGTFSLYAKAAAPAKPKVSASHVGGH
jgi:hypothetical protein